ncbi:MAG: hypothetical protein HQK97_01550 [Nitrospirae bacterium]|nr:hypothetical protein [Nitrospirota bacterium]
MKCTKCGAEVSECLDNCSTCRTYAGAPNVRFAEKTVHQNALNARYNDALQIAKANGTHNELSHFDGAMKKTFAVINVDIKKLYDFITDDSMIYSTYHLQVEGESRIPAVFEDDSQRRRVEAILFASYGKHIRYAALSYDKKGLTSYGPYSMTLREISIEARATLLENNSYPFLDKHNIIKSTDVPDGFCSTWGERHKLAVAKLHDRILSTTTEAQYAKILLESEGKRPTDEFIEVHIYGGFDNKAIESVTGISKGVYKNPERGMLPVIKKVLKKKGITWIEQ